MKLEGKVAIVTGGARGNGFAAAKCMAKEGADIVIADICADMETIPYKMSTEDTMAKAVKSIEALGRKAMGIKCDVRKSADVEAMVDKVLETFGHIDILVNNAGNSSMVAIAEMDEDTWDEVIDTHLKGTYLCSRFVLPHMIDQHSGKVVNISSVGGQAGFGMGGHYCAAKHGIIGLSKSIAMEVADHGVNVNVVCPGTVWTDMMKGIAEYFGMEEESAKEQFFSRYLIKEPEITADDIGRAVLFLVSEDAKCITGNMITVDCGWTAQAP
jgi:NAD(P)-dependent dehydrogenase (short-subunit alcohol dehydrogenase family)